MWRKKVITRNLYVFRFILRQETGHNQNVYFLALQKSPNNGDPSLNISH